MEEYGAQLPPKVNFLIAGAQKAGTTALHAFLSEHHALYLPEKKELHYFNREDIDWREPDHQRYEALFSAAGTRLAGEATPIYTFWPDALERIAAYNPAMKLVIVLRQPAERAHSHWAMERERGDETLTFSDAIRIGRERISESSWALRRFSYVERGFYYHQASRALRLFGERNVLFVEQRDLAERLAETLDVITDFLGVDHFRRYPESRIVRPRATTVAQAPLEDADRNYLEELYHDDLLTLEQITGRSFPSLKPRGMNGSSRARR